MANKHHSRYYSPGGVLNEHAGDNSVIFVTPGFDIIHVESAFVRLCCYMLKISIIF